MSKQTIHVTRSQIRELFAQRAAGAKMAVEMFDLLGDGADALAARLDMVQANTIIAAIDCGFDVLVEDLPGKKFAPKRPDPLYFVAMLHNAGHVGICTDDGKTVMFDSLESAIRKALYLRECDGEHEPRVWARFMIFTNEGTLAESFGAHETPHHPV